MILYLKTEYFKRFFLNIIFDFDQKDYYYSYSEGEKMKTVKIFKVPNKSVSNPALSDEASE